MTEVLQAGRLQNTANINHMTTLTLISLRNTVKSRRIGLAWQCGSAIQNTTKMVIDRHIGRVLYGEFC